MPEQRIADILNLQPRFLRSAHLERDFRDPAALGGYVVTDFARSALARMREGLRPNSGKRAWRITGHYGAGKSSFALLLAHLLSGKEANIPPQVRRVVDFGRNEPPFVSVLVTCAREPLAVSILRGLFDAAQHIYGRRSNPLVAEP